MNDVMPEGEAIRLFAVPITDELTREAVAVLGRFRELAASALSVEDPEEFEQNTNSLFRKEVAEIDQLGEPLAAERHKLHDMLIDTADLTTDNALDHVRALEHDLVMQPPPVWSPLTLSRVVMEGVLFSEYLLDSTIPLNRRLARLAGIWRTDATYALKQAEAYGQEPAEAGQMLAYVEDCLQKCQAVERHDRRGKINGYSFGSESAALDLNITERATAVMPNWLPAPYRLTSGVSHNRPWMIGRARDLAGGNGLAGEAATVMAAVMVALGSIEVTVNAFGKYFGVDVSEEQQHMEDERTAFLYRAIGIAHAQ
ncbi:hypothetical protein [Streptomyces griseorubiginosus]|uniref:hypothetical protein n=1 Tax=Streptomyces griseorubiginosus TaxID=67304 RepID=UPI0036EB61E2